MDRVDPSELARTPARAAGRTAAVALLLVVGYLLLAEPAGAALPECPDTVTTADVTEGQDAIGYTVRQGEVPESFDVEILGVLEGGLGPGRDLIIVDTSGPVIDAGAGGISAGMSGSPVYTLGGELIGAVAYGFSGGPSSIGGVTPADPDMLALLGQTAKPLGSAPAAQPRTAKLDRSLRHRIARHEDVPARAVASQMGRMPVPLALSGGLLPQHRALLDEAVAEAGAPFFITGGASAAAGPPPPSATVAPGDAFAAALSYGDITQAAIGTTTYVCDEAALAFGHPFLFNGRTLMGANRASVLAIVDDPTFGPYKLAQVTEPVGTVDLDRLAALRATLGEAAPTVPITQDTTAPDLGASRLDARTDVVRAIDAASDFLPFTAFIHMFANIDTTFDQVSGGSARVSWTVNGIETDSGDPWSVDRTNRFVSKRDISYAAPEELLEALTTLTSQKLEDIEFSDVDIDVSVREAERRYQMDGVRWAVNDGAFHRVKKGFLSVRPGDEIRARVRLDPSGQGPEKVVPMSFEAPDRNSFGPIRVTGAPRARRGGDLLCALFGECGKTRAKTFPKLLKSLEKGPRNDQLVGTARFRRHGAQQIVEQQNRVVEGQRAIFVLVGHDGSGRAVPDGAP